MIPTIKPYELWTAEENRQHDERWAELDAEREACEAKALAEGRDEHEVIMEFIAEKYPPPTEP